MYCNLEQQYLSRSIIFCFTGRKCSRASTLKCKDSEHKRVGHFANEETNNALYLDGPRTILDFSLMQRKTKRGMPIDALKIDVIKRSFALCMEEFRIEH